MSELTFNADEMRALIDELVPEYQRTHVLAAMDLSTDAEFDAAGTRLTGESAETSFLFYTGAGTAKGSMWAAVKAELYDLLCTSSKTYSHMRSEGAATIKNLITLIATSVAASFHVGLGVVTGAVTIALMAALKIGTNAWCMVNKPVLRAS